MEEKIIENRTVVGYLTGRTGKKNVVFEITFSQNTTSVKFNNTVMIFHHFYPERGNNDAILGFDLFNAWLRTVNEISYIKMLAAARIAGVEFFSEGAYVN